MSKFFVQYLWFYIYIYVHTLFIYYTSFTLHTYTSISDPFVDYQEDLININILSGISFTISFKINMTIKSLIYTYYSLHFFILSISFNCILFFNIAEYETRLSESLILSVFLSLMLYCIT